MREQGHDVHLQYDEEFTLYAFRQTREGIPALEYDVLMDTSDVQEREEAR